MSELIQLAAEIARGDYHPSHCVEDYRKGVGRETFAAMAGEYADRLRGKVRVLKDAAKRIAELEAGNEQLKVALDVAERAAESRLLLLKRIDRSTASRQWEKFEDVVGALHAVTRPTDKEAN